MGFVGEIPNSTLVTRGPSGIRLDLVGKVVAPEPRLSSLQFEATCRSVTLAAALHLTLIEP